MSRILVVDDEATVRALLRDVLELEGHEVDEAPDGPTALDHIESTRPDLVLLDVMMPGMSGIDVLSEIRHHEGAIGGLPVAMLTAAGDDETTWAGWTNGASVYLNKPFDHLNLLTWIDRLLDRTPTAPAA
jgi:two-component system sensor histidine kinase ChiS